MLTIDDLVKDNQSQFDFQWLAGMENAATIDLEHGMASADIIGHLNLIHVTDHLVSYFDLPELLVDRGDIHLFLLDAQ